MMKKLTSLVLAAVLALSLVACGNSNNNNGGSADKAFSADLTEFYGTLFQSEDGPMMMEITDDMWEYNFPGLDAVELKQCVLYTAAISAVAAEVDMVEVANADDVETVKAIFQQRIDDQVAGGAWYPATIEVWEKNSEIVVIDNYVCLFVGENKDDLVEAFKALG